MMGVSVYTTAGDASSIVMFVSLAEAETHSQTMGQSKRAIRPSMVGWV
jgi:hypothetical protein